jgi:hypothetical protein
VGSTWLPLHVGHWRQNADARPLALHPSSPPRAFATELAFPFPMLPGETASLARGTGPRDVEAAHRSQQPDEAGATAAAGDDDEDDRAPSGNCFQECDRASDKSARGTGGWEGPVWGPPLTATFIFAVRPCSRVPPRPSSH